MESLYILIPISVILVFLIGVVFWWSLKSGQLDDLEGPAYRILMDDDQAKPRENSELGADENEKYPQKNEIR